MIETLKNWNGNATLDGVAIPKNLTIESIKVGSHINLTPKGFTAENQANNNSQVVSNDTMIYRVQVRAYMTKPATPSFDFMAKWNKNIPMPLRVMVGEKIKETNGMVYMKLHGDILEKETRCCMKCGKPITNPISRYFGMGPECGGHNYTNPFDSEEELKTAVSSYRERLKNITWEGWIIKSAIENLEILKED